MSGGFNSAQNSAFKAVHVLGIYAAGKHAWPPQTLGIWAFMIVRGVDHKVVQVPICWH